MVHGASQGLNRKEYKIAFYDLGARVFRILRLRRITKRLGKNSVKIFERGGEERYAKDVFLQYRETDNGAGGPSTTRNSRVGISSGIAGYYQPFNCYFVARVWPSAYERNLR